MNEKYEGYCVECRFKIKSFAGLTKCPNCGSEGIPCSISEDVNIEINWHELRILCIWAENWGRRINEAGTVYSIVQTLQEQFPDKTPLTLAGEVNQLKDGIIPGFKNVHLLDGEGKEIQT